MRYMGIRTPVRAAAVALGALVMAMPAADLPPLFAPPGMWTNDNGFAAAGGVYHQAREAGPVLAFPQSSERLETPQLWTRNGRWYLHFGAAPDQPEIAATWRAAVPAKIKDRRRVNCLYCGKYL